MINDKMAKMAVNTLIAYCDGKKCADCAVTMTAKYYMPNRKGWPDLFGLVQATADILEKAGIVEDDGYIADVAYSCIAGVEPVWPRAEIKVIPIPDDKLNDLHPKLRM